VPGTGIEPARREAGDFKFINRKPWEQHIMF